MRKLGQEPYSYLILGVSPKESREIIDLVWRELRLRGWSDVQWTDEDEELITISVPEDVDLADQLRLKQVIEGHGRANGVGRHHVAIHATGRPSRVLVWAGPRVPGEDEQRSIVARQLQGWMTLFLSGVALTTHLLAGNKVGGKWGSAFAPGAELRQWLDETGAGADVITAMALSADQLWLASASQGYLRSLLPGDAIASAPNQPGRTSLNPTDAVIRWPGGTRLSGSDDVDRLIVLASVSEQSQDFVPTGRLRLLRASDLPYEDAPCWCIEAPGYRIHPVFAVWADERILAETPPYLEMGSQCVFPDVLATSDRPRRWIRESFDPQVLGSPSSWWRTNRPSGEGVCSVVAVARVVPTTEGAGCELEFYGEGEGPELKDASQLCVVTTRADDSEGPRLCVRFGRLSVDEEGYRVRFEGKGPREVEDIVYLRVSS
ncbi:MAG: hypothetical protein H6737_09775 [Alphaproteobacteria bacterium]|nr:hypothetical protein [Alphaproteobacteria bacterium]